MDFIDGLVAGMLYFYIVPFYLAIFSGEIITLAPWIENYSPIKHVEGTFVIFLGWLSILAFHFSIRASGWKKAQARIKNSKVRSFKYVLLVYLLTLILSQIMLGDDAHWRHGVQELQRTSPAYAIVKGFSNAYRFMIGGFVLYMYFNKMIDRKMALALLICLTTLDVLLTYNRIGLVFFALGATILYRKYWLYFVPPLVFVLPLISYASSTWTVVRGLYSTSGGGVAGMIDAWRQASLIVQTHGVVINSVGQSLFEANNLASLNFVVTKLVDQIGFQYGATMFVRPLTTFIPGAIWSGKPPVFATYVGANGSGIEGHAINSTIIGEAFGNFGYVFPLALCLALLIYANLFRWADRFLPGSEYAGFYIGIAMWRFDINFASSSLYAILLVIFCSHLALNILKVLPLKTPK
ncbi:hypothetical protein [Celeribacter halophilus]|uniref:hypothetical protein n=1 Tax=Celeribacter halophilus TaxID=576117 RepID=UPI003A907168